MTNTSKDKEEIISARKKINECKKVDNKEKQISCVYETLHSITEAQDIVNLTIREMVDNSEDPRWIPIHITDNANAVILGISSHKGNPETIIKTGYVEEKVVGLYSKWNTLNWKYKKYVK